VNAGVSTAVRAGSLVWRAAPGQAMAQLGLTLVGGVVPVAVAWLTKLTLDRLVAPGPHAVLLGFAAALAGLAAVAAVVPQVGEYQRAELGRRVGLRAKDELFTAIGRFIGLARFEDPAFLDRLRLAEQSAGSPGQLADSALSAGQAVLLLVGFVGSLAVINPWFTAVVLAAAVPACIVQLRLSRQRAAMLWEITPTQRREFFYTTLLGTADAAKEIRLYGLGGFLRGRMNREIRAANTAQRRTDRRELTVQGMLILFAAAISGAGLVWAVQATGRGELSVGDVAMFLAAAVGVQAAVDGLVTTIAGLHQGLTLFGHYRVVVEGGPDLPTPVEPAELPRLRRGIELRDVWFRYSADHPWVLRGVNLFIPQGQAVALVGLNGSGKSTLVKLLCRFYDPTLGQILWDGVDIRDVAVDDLRSRMGAVFQDFMAYDLSARENVAVGDLSALEDPERIRRATLRAGVHDMVEALPRGYDTLLTRMFISESERDDPQAGVLLSGGQWQRLAVARAFLRQDRDMMILDEPSAGLDAQAELEVHTALRQMRHGRTSLLISHRLGAVRDANLIAVLADGVIAEWGSHAELLAVDGRYAYLFSVQAAGYVTEETPA
jgi:ATP-binding cassette, subfamily B, bacterial